MPHFIVMQHFVIMPYLTAWKRSAVEIIAKSNGKNDVAR